MQGSEIADWRLSDHGAALRQAIRAGRRSGPVRLMATMAAKFLRAYYNEGFYTFEQNGEAFALDTFAAWWGATPLTVWDVGANDGGWAEAAHGALPRASIHSFEIVPAIATAYRERINGAPWSHLHALGLSDRADQVEVTWNRECDSTSAIAIRQSGVPGGDYARLTCPVSTIDCEIARGLAAPDLLKIDTEGHDAAVLRGARELLDGPGAPQMIQFEYGDTWLPSHETLEDVQGLLEAAGYRVGRLYPNHVAFKAYAYGDDHFRMGNMIAARDPRLVSALAA